MGVIASFSYDTFIALFPQFNYLSGAQVQFYWNMATGFHRNDGGGPVTNVCMQEEMLQLVTAHVIQLFAPKRDGQGPSELVGRINNASQGSVSVGSEMPGATASSAWWQQTQYGAAYWELSKPFRTMRYIPGPPRPTAPWPIAGTTFIGDGPWGWGR